MRSILIVVVVVAGIIALSDAGHVPKRNLCPKNELWFDCGEPCQAKCATLNEPCNIRYIRCPDGCYCRPGFARHPVTNKCIPTEQCPPKQ